jgi:hypothetical protein
MFVFPNAAPCGTVIVVSRAERLGRPYEEERTMRQVNRFTSRVIIVGCIQHQVKNFAADLRRYDSLAHFAVHGEGADILVAQAAIVGDRIEFRGLTGTHSLGADSSEARILAHWQGFRATNEATYLRRAAAAA